MKLNLGCGADLRDGYVNVDFRPLHPEITVVDLSKTPWPFESSSAEEILMFDVLEHFPYAKAPLILLECFRVLKIGGQLVIQVPDAMQTMRAMCQEGQYLCNRCGESMLRRVSPTRGGDPDINETICPKCGQTADDISRAAVGRFYGGQDYVGNFHQNCFTSRSLDLIMQESGFKLLSDESTTEHYVRNWTLKKTYVKADIW